MRGQHILEEAAGVGLDDLIAVKAADLHDLIGQGFGHDIHFAVGSLDDGILLIRVQGDGKVAGERPDSRSPDDEEELALIDVRELAVIVVHRELDIDGGAGIVLIFDLGLGESGLVLGAPVDGLESLIDMAVAVHLAEHADFISFEALVHGLIGVLPVADDAEALEALHLEADVLFGIVMAGGAEIRDAHGLMVELLLLDDGGLDGHAVVIPAGDIGGIIAAHGVGADDKVLERLIECVTHVDPAVGERRAVMQGKARVAFVLLEHFIINILLLPALEHLGFALGQTRAHGKVSLRQIEGGVKIL